MRVLNQFTEQFSVNELADLVQKAGNRLGLGVEINSIENPRKEAEEHYYNATHSGLLELGLKPHFLTQDILVDMLEVVLRNRDNIDMNKIMPRVRWKG